MPKRVARKPRRNIRRKKMMRKRPTTLVNNSGLSPIPSRFITKLKYAEALTLTGFGLQTYQWNLNSLFDPNRSGLGHQPYGYDQLCGASGTSLYNRYRVYKVDYVLTVACDTANIHYGVLPSNLATPPINNVTEMRENPRAQYAVQNPGGTLKKITGSISLPALTGRTQAQYMADDSYQAVYNATPSEVMTLSCYSQAMNDGSSDSLAHTFNILLVYHVEFFDPHVLDQS